MNGRDMSRPRYREYVPSIPASDARQLRALPPHWGESIDESAIDGLVKRTDALASVLARAGRQRDAAELRRRLSLLTRTDDLHRHAGRLETLVGIYRALAVFAQEPELGDDDSMLLAQTGALDTETTAAHGPAFRETAALRNRAFRLVSATLTQIRRPTPASTASPDSDPIRRAGR
jgi:hypothetical protein